MMNSYSRLDINLLPPELLPGPAVRYALLINVFIVLVTLSIIAVDIYFGMLKLDVERERGVGLEAQKVAKTQVANDFDALASFGEKVNRYGRLVAMASGDYAELPFVVARISKILPDGVYLESISNKRASGRGAAFAVGINLRASRRDPALVLATLRAFKNDPLFASAVMPTAEFQETSLQALIERNGITWTAKGADVPESIIAEELIFTIDAIVPRPTPDLGMSTLWDVSAQLQAVEKSYTETQLAASQAASAAPAKAAPGSQPAQTAPLAGSPPPGVEVVEVH